MMEVFDKALSGNAADPIGGMGWCQGCNQWKRVKTVAMNSDGQAPELEDAPPFTACGPCLHEVGL